MAGSSSTYQQAVVTMVEEFLKAIDELTNETKARLSKLSEISEVAASIEKDKGEVKDTSRVHNCISLIKNFLTGLLFGSYTELLSKLADSFSMVKELENKQKEDKSFQLPEVMQARIDSFKHYLEKAKGRLEGIDKVLDELIDKVYDAKGKHFEISDQEMAHLEMNTAKVNRSLEACKKYLGEAENEIKQLESDIASEMRSFNMKAAAISSGIGAMLMIGGAYFVPADILKLSLKEVAQKLGYIKVLLLGAAAVAGAIAFLVWKGCPFSKEKYYCKSLLIFRNHSRLRQELERDRMNLRSKETHSNLVF